MDLPRPEGALRKFLNGWHRPIWAYVAGAEPESPLRHVADLVCATRDKLQEEVVQDEQWLHARAVERANAAGRPQPTDPDRARDMEPMWSHLEEDIQALWARLQPLDAAGTLRVWGTMVSNIDLIRRTLRNIRRSAQSRETPYEARDRLSDYDVRNSWLDDQVERELPHKRALIALLTSIQEQYASQPNITVDRLRLPDAPSRGDDDATPEQEPEELLGRAGGHRPRASASPRWSTRDANPALVAPEPLRFSNAAGSDFNGTYTFRVSADDIRAASAATASGGSTGAVGGHQTATLAADIETGPGFDLGAGDSGDQRAGRNADVAGMATSHGPATIAVDPPDEPPRIARATRALRDAVLGIRRREG